MQNTYTLFFLFFNAIIIGGCDYDINLKKSEQKKYIALGDSYTVGEGVSTEVSFPYLLKDSLEKRGILLHEPLVVAKTGWTTDELNEGINNAEITGKYDLVTLLIGVNNQFRGRDTANYREEFRALLNRAINFSRQNAHGVIVISIPDWGVTPFAINYNPTQIGMEIDIFNNIAREECGKADVEYVNITDISRTKYDGEYLIASDGLHPSGKMYALWVERISPVAIQMLTVE